MIIIFGFLILLLLVSPVNDIISMEMNSIGLYIEKLPRMMFNTDPFGDKKFVNEWTMFYWGWWLIFIPIMGMFIAKISRGRTLKQVILGQMIWAALDAVPFLESSADIPCICREMVLWIWYPLLRRKEMEELFWKS